MFYEIANKLAEYGGEEEKEEEDEKSKDKNEIDRKKSKEA